MNYEEKINELHASIASAKNYLNDTDYMSLRQLDGGAPVPEEVRNKRAVAREQVNKCEEEIKRLELMRKENEKEWMGTMRELPILLE